MSFVVVQKLAAVTCCQAATANGNGKVKVPEYRSARRGKEVTTKILSQSR